MRIPSDINIPTIAICITSFNSENYISRAINSALNQSVNINEIIIIDDSSNDNSYEIIRSISKNNKKIKIFKNRTNKGVAYCRNKLIELARSEYIIFFDDDDYSYPERTYNQISRIINYKIRYGENLKVLCYSSRKQIYEDNNKKILHPIGINENAMCPNGTNLAEIILFGSINKEFNGSCPTNSLMAKTEDLRFIKSFDEKFRRLEDTDLNIRAALNGFHFIGIKKVLLDQYLYKKNYKNFSSEIFYFNMLYEKYIDIIYTKDDRRFIFEKKIISIKDNIFKKKYLNVFIALIILIVFHPKLIFKRFFRSYTNLFNLFKMSITRNF